MSFVSILLFDLGNNLCFIKIWVFFSFARSSVFRFCHNLNPEFFFSTILFFCFITFWVLGFVTTFFLHSFVANWVLEFYLDGILFTPICLNFKYFHCTTFWPLRAHAGKYPPALLGPFSFPGSPSAVHDRVCWLKRKAFCSACPALVNEMVGNRIFYCVLHNCDSV